MNKLLLGLLLLTPTTVTHASINLEEGKKRVYNYECSYSTPYDEQDRSILVVVRGEVEDLSELQGKQEVVVTGDGEVRTLTVGNCKVEI